MKILIVRFSSIGDIVLTTPVIRCVKQQLANADIHYLTKPAYQSILASNPYINKIHLLGDDWQAMIANLKEEHFDCIIDLHHNLRTLRLKRALPRVKSFSFNKLNGEKWLLTAFKINVLPKKHIVDRYLDTVKSFGVINDGKGLDYFIPKEEEVNNERLPLSHCAGYIAFVIGATYNTKKLPLHKLKQLCSLINYPVILLGGQEDEKNGAEIAAVNDIKVFNACGKFSLNESADLVRNARLVITHDTGLMHVAAAFQKPIISIWGNTVPAFGMTPYFGSESNAAADKNFYINTRLQPQSVISEIKKLYCRPCSKIGFRKCPLGHFKCMEKQDMAAINRSVISLQSSAN